MLFRFATVSVACFLNSSRCLCRSYVFNLSKPIVMYINVPGQALFSVVYVTSNGEICATPSPDTIYISASNVLPRLLDK